jgi:hypothetical protein
MNIRNILAVFAGVFGAGLAIAMIEMAGHAMVLGDAGAGLFAIVAAGYGIGATIASWIANRISSSRWPAVVACLILAGLAVSNLFLIAHPVWFIPVAALLIFAGFKIGQLDPATPSGDRL